MTTCPGHGVSCHTTLYRIKSDIQTQLNNNIRVESSVQQAQRSAENFYPLKTLQKT